MRPFSPQSLKIDVAVGIVCIGALGVLDVLTGQETSSAPFYVPVVGVLAWRDGRSAMLVAVVLAGLVGLIADHLVSEPLLSFETSYSHPAVPWWNAVSRVVVYLVVGLSISKVRAANHRKDQTLEDLRTALNQVRTLEGLLPICAWCKRIRDDEHGGEWIGIEQYLTRKTQAEFTHGICGKCMSQIQVPRSKA